MASIIEDLVGLPFLLLPGKPPEHKVVGNTTSGLKVRVCHVQMVFNDAILLDSVHGNGEYIKNITSNELDVLYIAQQLYGITIEEAIPVWQKMPKMGKAVEWINENNPKSFN